MTTLPETTIAELAQRLVDQGYSVFDRFQLDNWCNENIGDIVQIYIDDPQCCTFSLNDAIGAMAQSNTMSQASYAIVRLSTAVEDVKFNAKIRLISHMEEIECERLERPSNEKENQENK